MSEQRPFNIRIFVAEGLADGLRHVEKSNWIGLGIVCPRGRYSLVKKRAELGGSGVYLLVGRLDGEDSPTLYIGEADEVRARLDSHHANKEFWQEAIVFTTKGDPLNKAEVQYLEAQLVEIARKTKRCRLDNGNMPQRPNLSEADQAEVEGYLDEMLSLLPVLGVTAFEPAGEEAKGRRLYYWKGSGWDATGYVATSGFAVREGSLARATTVPSMQEHVPGDYRKRQQLIDEGVLVSEPAGYRFSVDHVFSSPSLAASVCAGRSANGRIEWKDSAGVTLKEHQEREAQA